jgi:Raf kinase inhibitor-like YbhB/YbcL family protein
MSASYSPNPYDFLPSVPALTLTSKDISEGGKLPDPQLSQAFGVVDEGDISPHLEWSEPPAETRSFVVSCYDPDAPTVSGFWHWIVYDIPATVRDLPTNAGQVGGANLPQGAKMLINDAGQAGFLGAAPPPGHKEHRYIFAVSALGVDSLPIDETTSPSVCHFQMFGAGVLARGLLTAKYGR